MRRFLTLHDPRQTETYYRDGLWKSDTFYGLMAGWAEERPAEPALRDGRVTVSWGELRSWVDGVAADFRLQGLVPGDRVCLWMSNRLESVVVFLACSREGFACNPSLHRTNTCAEVLKLLAYLKASILVTEPGWGADRDKADFESSLTELPYLRKVYDPAALPAAGSVPETAPFDNPDSIAYLAFTSGTTGAPKCVMHSSNTLLANARDMVADWGFGPGTRLLTLSPLSHHIAWVAVAEWLVSGCQLVTDDPPQGLSRLDWIIETGATYVMGVPTHAMDILAEQKSRNLERIGVVEVFYMAGAPIPPVVAEDFLAQDIKPQNVYGMTENSSHQYTHPDDDPQTIVTTCGRGGRAYEVRVFDADNADQPVKTGETGQIGGRGAALMLGYYGNQEATEASFNRDGWFLSGDLGSLDASGNLTIEGRLKDLIIRGGHNIHPSRIEALAVRHKGVERAAAFPIADERLGERVCLAVIGTVEAGTLLDHLSAQGLSKYDMPEYFIRMDEFPLTASGKILKRVLAEDAKRGAIDPTPVRLGAKGARPGKELE